MYLQNAFKFQINIVCHQWRCYNIYLVWLILLLLISCWTCRRKKGKHKRLKLNPSWLNKERFRFWYICQLNIYYCDEQDPERLTNIFFFFFFFFYNSIFSRMSCCIANKTRPIDYAIKIILHLRVCCGRFFFCVEIF